MTNLSNQILDSIDILINNATSKLQFDKTVEAQIVEIKDLVAGEYKVKYDGNIFSAFSNDEKQTYNIGDKVFIKVPEGDLSKKKFIENKISSKSLTENDLENLQANFIPVEPPLDKIYNTNFMKELEYGIIAGAPEESGKDAKTIFNYASVYDPDDPCNITFQRYLSIYNYIIISADFKTVLNFDFISGNYGLELKFYNKEDPNNAEKDIIQTLDVDSFNGNAYKFISYNNQRVIAKLSVKNTLGLKSVRFFEKDFPHYDYSGGDKEQINDSKNNIFVTNISIHFAERIDLTQNLYYLQIQSPKGLIFYNNNEKLTLTGRLIYNKNSIMTKDNAKCQWYKRDSSVMVGNRFYDKTVGAGWRPIIKEEDPTIINSINFIEEDYDRYIEEEKDTARLLRQLQVQMYELISYYTDLSNLLKIPMSQKLNELKGIADNIILSKDFKTFEEKRENIINQLKDPEEVDFNEITVSGNMVYTQLDYQLVVIYNNKIKLQKTSSLFKYNFPYTVDIKQRIRSGFRELYLDKQLDDENEYQGMWYISLPNNSYSKINAEKADSIIIDEYLIYPVMTFICDIFTPINGKDVLIGTKEYFITDEGDKETITATFLGDTLFKYDANGDISYDEAQIQKSLICQLNQVGKNPVFEWSIGDGEQEIFIKAGANNNKPEQENLVNPKTFNSMLTDIWVDTEGKIYYNIRQKYREGCNNTLKVKVSVDNQEFFFKKDIIFLKDGDQGTNGTTYSVLIKPCNSTGTQVFDSYTPLEYKNGKFEEKLFFKAQVFENGELPGADIEITYKWSKWQSINGESDIELWNGTAIYDYENNPINTSVIGVTGKTEPNSKDNTKNNYYLKLQVDINTYSKGQSENLTLYNLFPIDVLVGDIIKIDEKFSLKIPRYIQYNSSGEYPKFDRSPIVFKANDIDYSNKVISLNEDLIKITAGGQLSPISKFLTDKIFVDKIGLILCPVDDNNYIIHPVLMYLNTYGNEAINGWDGTKLDIDGKGQYILAPQIGAGIKHKDNTFTGVIMGKDTSKDKIGLYGYDHGISAFGFTQDGSAFIGKPGKGQILFNNGGDHATIESAGFKYNQTGTKIDLTTGTLQMNGSDGKGGSITLDSSAERTPFIISKNGGSYFRVDWDGTLHATGVEISGGIGTGNLVVGDSGIGRKTIIKDSVTYTANIWGAKDKFFVDTNGVMHSEGANVTGVIKAEDLLLKQDGKYVSILDENKEQIDKKYLDLGNITLDGETGNITMGGDISIAGTTIIGGTTTIGGDLTLEGALTVRDPDGGMGRGYFGAATGYDGQSITYGVAIASNNSDINALTTTPHLIVTDNTVRMSSGLNAYYVTDRFLWVKIDGKSMTLEGYIKSVINSIKPNAEEGEVQ